VPGGPRSQRVDLLLESLVDYDPTVPAPAPLDPKLLPGHSAISGSRLGLTSNLVNTVEEEQNLTDHLVLVDYVSTLMLSWHSLRRFFNRTGSDVFLGTQLVPRARAGGAPNRCRTCTTRWIRCSSGRRNCQTIRLTFPTRHLSPG
jgi:hypothetical protein